MDVTGTTRQDYRGSEHADFEEITSFILHRSVQQPRQLEGTPSPPRLLECASHIVKKEIICLSEGRLFAVLQLLRKSELINFFEKSRL